MNDDDDDDDDNNNNDNIPKPVTEHEDITVLWNQRIERFWQTGLT
jgi:hypothetical protein